MAFQYLPKNILEGNITLENIGKEFVQPTEQPMLNSVLCDTETQSYFETSMGVGTDPRGCCWGGDNGEYFYIVDNNNNTVYRFSGSDSYQSNFSEVGTPQQSANIGIGGIGGSNGEQSPQGVVFSPDGSKMFIVGDGIGLSEWSLSTPWDLTTLSYVRAISLAQSKIKEYAPTDLAINNNGKKIYIIGAYQDAIHTINLRYPYSLSRYVYNGKFLLLNQFGINLIDTPTSIAFSLYGDEMYISGYQAGSSASVFKYKLTKAFDATSGYYDSILNIQAAETNPQSIAYATNGIVDEYPGDVGNDHTITANITVVGDGLSRYQLPAPSIPTPLNLGDYYRGEQFVPDNDLTKAIPTKYDLTQISGRFTDSSVDEITLSYQGNSYITAGVDFDFLGNYIYTNHGDDSDTLIFRHTLDSNFVLNSLDPSSVQTFSIENEKMLGFTQQVIYSDWYRYSHDGNTYNLQYPANASETTAWNINSTGIYTTANSSTLIGAISPTEYNNYRVKTLIRSLDTDNDTNGWLAGFKTINNGTDDIELTLGVYRTLKHSNAIVPTGWWDGGLQPSGTPNENPDDDTWALMINANQMGQSVLYGQPLATDQDSAGVDYDVFPGYTLMHGNINDIKTNNWGTATLFLNQTWIETIKEGPEYGFYIGAFQNDSAEMDFPTDWRNTPLGQTFDSGGISGNQFIWIYLNLDTDEMKGERFTPNGAGGSVVDLGYTNIYSRIAAQQNSTFEHNLKSTLHNFKDGVSVGPANMSQSYSYWSNITVNGINTNNEDLYEDKFASHKLGAGGRKLYTSVNTVFIESNNAPEVLTTSQIYEYDLLVTHSLQNAEYSGNTLSIYSNAVTDKGRIYGLTFGLDSDERDGAMLYTLSAPGSNSNPTTDGVLTQYKLVDGWNISTASLHQQIELNTGFQPKTLTFSNEGKTLLLGGDSSEIVVGDLTSPYNIGTMTINTSGNTFNSTTLDDISGLFSTEMGDKLFISGWDSDAGASKVVKYEEKTIEEYDSTIRSSIINSISMSSFTSGELEYVSINGYKELIVPAGCDTLSFAAVGAGGYGAPGTMYQIGVFGTGYNLDTDLPAAQTAYETAFNAVQEGCYGGGGGGLVYVNQITVQEGDVIGIHAGIPPIVEMYDSAQLSSSVTWPRYSVKGNQFDASTGQSNVSVNGSYHPARVWKGDGSLILQGDADSAHLSPSNSWISINGEIVAVASGGGGVKKTGNYANTLDAITSGGSWYPGTINNTSLSNYFTNKGYGEIGGGTGGVGTVSSIVSARFSTSDELYTEMHIGGVGGYAAGWDSAENGKGGLINGTLPQNIPLVYMHGCAPNSGVSNAALVSTAEDIPHGALYTGIGPGPVATEGGGINIYGRSGNGLTNLLATTALESEVKGSYPTASLASSPILTATYGFDSDDYNFFINDSYGVQPSNTFGQVAPQNDRIAVYEEDGYQYVNWASLKSYNNQDSNGGAPFNRFGDAVITSNGIEGVRSFKNFGGGGAGQFDGTAIDSSGTITYVIENEKLQTSEYYASGGAGIVRLVFGRQKQRSFPEFNVQQVYEVEK